MTTAPVNSTAAALATASSASSASSASTSSTSSGNALTKLSSDLNDFLQLLTTQLQNQDPLSPMDSTQFTAQLVAFTGVEQQIGTNSKLDTLIGVDQGSQLAGAANFIGDTVQAPSSSISLDSSGVASQIGYNLPSAASAVTITISDSSGNTVSSGNGPTTQGPNIVAWNGQDSSGNTLAAGTYTFTVSALDQSQNQMSNVTTSIVGTVTNVASSSTGGTQLSIGSVTVPLSTVTSVQKPSSSSSTSSS
jgi:flagellar basal-body rod modification protein FlgD